MMLARFVSRFGLQVVPAVCATVLSAALLTALQLSPGPSAHGQRGNAQASDDDTVYIDVLPRINRDVAAVPAAVPTKAPTAPASSPVAQREQVAAIPPGRDHATRNAGPRANPAVTAKTDATPKADPAVKVDTVATTNPAPAPTMPSPQPVVAAAPLVDLPPAAIENPTLAPPLRIVSAQQEEIAPEPSRVFGMAVPRPVSDTGSAVIDVAKLPIQFADTLVARPAWRVGEKIVTGVAGWVGGGR